ncbi:hypothetical protein HDU87_000855 [Geranomyces variabilis]|uniref:mannan endo-1,4-beta-mannosidase n=1 Tax=Geranomyces variabilis TaxID=109894 RepID=A0AAD5XJA7_9FUNG|nr:hypothetical protein HDU87_000855 [Geranomyces variabilis]
MFQNEGLRTYNETLFQVMDSALAIARDSGVRVIIPLIDWWTWRGGIEEMARFRGKSRWEFFTDPDIRSDFKDLIQRIILRTNTITGRMYKDDEYVIAWELGNELGGWFGMPLPEWVLEMSAYIKSIDPNHLVLDGAFAITQQLGALEGGLNNQFFRPLDTKLDVYAKSGVLASPNVDMFRDHYYVSNDDGDFSRRAQSAVAQLNPAGKAFAVTEFGFQSSTVFADLLNTISNDVRMTGALLWSLRSHGYSGGYYTHLEKDSWLSYRLPGYTVEEGSPADEISSDGLIRQFAWKIQGLDPAQQLLPRPQRPVLLPLSTASNIRWQGSAMASKYALARASVNGTADAAPANLQWNILSTTISDALPLPFYKDTTAQCGMMHYFSMAAQSDGGWSEWAAAQRLVEACPAAGWEDGVAIPWEH